MLLYRSTSTPCCEKLSASPITEHVDPRAIHSHAAMPKPPVPARWLPSRAQFASSASQKRRTDALELAIVPP